MMRTFRFADYTLRYPDTELRGKSYMKAERGCDDSLQRVFTNVYREEAQEGRLWGRCSLACLYVDTLQNMKYKMLANIIRRKETDRKSSVTFLPIPVCEGWGCGIAVVCSLAKGVVCALCEEDEGVFVEESCAVASYGVAMVAIWLQ